MAGVPAQRPLRVATLNVHGFTRLVELGKAVAAHGPYDVLAIQEGRETAEQYAAFGALVGMKLAVRRRAELELVNALYVANDGVDIEVVYDWDLQCRSTENRAAVAVVITRQRDPRSGGGGGAATSLTPCADQAQRAAVVTPDAAAPFLPTAPTAADGAAAQQQMDAGGQAQEHPIMFVCTHLDAYDEQHRLDQLDHLRVHLRNAIAEQQAEQDTRPRAPTPPPAPIDGQPCWWTADALAALTDDELRATFVSIVEATATVATQYRPTTVIIRPSTRKVVERAVLRKQAGPATAPAVVDDVDDANDKVWLDSAAFVVMGDMNALQETDYTPAQWLWLTGKRSAHGISSETWLTTTMTAPSGESVHAVTEPPLHEGEARDLGAHRGWSLVDARAVSETVVNVNGGNKPATSVYGARVDYVFGSVEMMKRWKVVSYKHINMRDLTDHNLVVCDLVPRIAESGRRGGGSGGSAAGVGGD